MSVNTVEFRELGKRFLFQGGSPYANSIADEIDKLRVENARLTPKPKLALVEAYRSGREAEREACAAICRSVARDCALMEDRDGASAAGECAEKIRGEA